MKKWLAVIILLVIIILDWLALDDIITGSESNKIGEYIFLALSFISFPFFYSFLKKKS